jgi:hypothetical protein
MDRLDKEGVPFGYEAMTYPITVSVPNSHCEQCGSKAISRDTVYTPDFFFKGWIIEAKGKFTARDRKRVRALMENWGATGARFGMLFQRDNKLSKASNTRYSEWCEKRGIPYAVGWFKKEWMR